MLVVPKALADPRRRNHPTSPEGVEGLRTGRVLSGVYVPAVHGRAGQEAGERVTSFGRCARSARRVTGHAGMRLAAGSDDPGFRPVEGVFRAYRRGGVRPGPTARGPRACAGIPPTCPSVGERSLGWLLEASRKRAARAYRDATATPDGRVNEASCLRVASSVQAARRLRVADRAQLGEERGSLSRRGRSLHPSLPVVRARVRAAARLLPARNAQRVFAHHAHLGLGQAVDFPRAAAADLGHERIVA
jgi:hypothetical protein